MSAASDKPALRAGALAARRAGGDPAALTAALERALAPCRGAVLAGYWPIRGEPDPRPAMTLHQGPVCLPVVIGPAQPLRFRLWRGETLVSGPYGTAHPPASSPDIVPEVLIVPLVAFDSALNRLGYGGGFYDRTLQTLRDVAPVVAIGLAWAVQQVPSVPVEATDQPLDAVVTDKATFRRGA